MECPKAVKPEASGEAPSGWRWWREPAKAPRRLSDIAFSDGDPDQNVFLNALRSAREKGARSDTYDFTSSTFGEIWLLCEYGDADVSLTKPTDARGKRCIVSYAGHGADETVNRIACKAP